jgi:hypothetical protein
MGRWVPSAGRDAETWLWRLRREPDGREKPVLVQVSGSAMASRVLPDDAARAVSTQGQTVAESFRNWVEPPRSILFFTVGPPKVIGGVPPLPEPDAIAVSEIVDWFRDRGFELGLENEHGAWTASLLPLTTNDDEPRRYEVGTSPVEVAERARNRFTHDSNQLFVNS